MSEDERPDKPSEEEAASSSSEQETSSDDEPMEVLNFYSFSGNFLAQVEYNIVSRAKRANAGNKMSALIESSIQEDDFYKTAYEGGFNEV